MTTTRPASDLRLAVLAPAAMHSTMVRSACRRGGIALAAIAVADSGSSGPVAANTAAAIGPGVPSLPSATTATDADSPALTRVPGVDGGFTALVDPLGANVAAAGESAEAIIVDFRGVAALEAVVADARYALATAGRTIEQLRVVVRLAVVAAHTNGAAADLAERLHLRGAAREHALVGSFGAVAAVLAELARHGGIDAIDLSPVLGAADADASAESLTAMVEHVLPRLAVTTNVGAADAGLGIRSALGLPAVPAKRAGARIPFAAFETEIPTGF